MRSFRGFFVAICFAVVGAFTYAIGTARDFFGGLFKGLAEPWDLSLSFDYGVNYSGHESPVDPAVLQSLRHEAGVSRVAAARHC